MGQWIFSSAKLFVNRFSYINLAMGLEISASALTRQLSPWGKLPIFHVMMRLFASQTPWSPRVTLRVSPCSVVGMAAMMLKLDRSPRLLRLERIWTLMRHVFLLSMMAALACTRMGMFCVRTFMEYLKISHPASSDLGMLTLQFTVSDTMFLSSITQWSADVKLANDVIGPVIMRRKGVFSFTLVEDSTLPLTLPSMVNCDKLPPS
mmetsp:Transcript_32169/g.68081  ORF Transcript_32169/g.68081 Transcript_32169/m.68081 type:complete len:206 (+) Transcript_32169:286-903(+)